MFGRLDLVRACLVSLDVATDRGVPVLVLDDCGPERITRAEVAAALEVSGREWDLVSNGRNLGYLATANTAAEVAGDADLVLVNSDVRVFPGWLESFQQALADNDDAASVSSFADNGSILSVPSAADPDPDALRGLAALRPAWVEIPVAVGHCAYYRRQALDAVGLFDPDFSPGYGEEVDWSLRARTMGLRHFAAVGAYVRHAEGASFGSGWRRRWLRLSHEARLAVRYPAQFRAIRSLARDSDSALAQAKRCIAEVLGQSSTMG